EELSDPRVKKFRNRVGEALAAARFPPESAKAVGLHGINGSCVGTRGQRVGTAGQVADNLQKIVPIQQDVRHVQESRRNCRMLKNEPNRSSNIATVNFGAGAWSNGLAVQIVRKERRPFVFSTLCIRAIDASEAQACGLKMTGAKLLKRVFGGKLYFAVERIGDGFVHFIQPCAGRTRAVDGAAREEYRAADAGPPCRFEEGDAAIQIAAAERGWIL